MKSRLKQALNSGDSVKIPKGFSREQKRNFILNSEEEENMSESFKTYDITFKGVNGNSLEDGSVAYLTVPKAWLLEASNPESDAGKMLTQLKKQIDELNSGQSGFIILPNDKDGGEEKVTLPL